MANKITYSTMLSEPRNNALALLIAANVPDPSIVSASEFRKWIYAREPDVKAIEFKGYPFLILHPNDTKPEDGGSKDGKKKFVQFSIELEVVTSDRGYGQNKDKGLANMDTISDNVMKTFMNMTNRKTLIANGMPFSGIDSTKTIPDVISNEQVFRRSFFLNFRGRMAVSA